MVNVFFTNHGYFAQDDFLTLKDALEYAKSKGFEATFIKPYTNGKPHKGGEVIGFWSILGGFKDRRTY